MEDIQREHRERDHCGIEYICTVADSNSVRVAADTR